MVNLTVLTDLFLPPILSRMSIELAIFPCLSLPGLNVVEFWCWVTVRLSVEFLWCILYVYELPDSLFKLNYNTCIFFVFVLMGWSLLPNALRHFQIYCASPNLGITRTWIFRLNFAKRPIFSGLRFFNEPDISDSGPQPGLNPRTFYLEAITLPRENRGRLNYTIYPSHGYCENRPYKKENSKQGIEPRSSLIVDRNLAIVSRRQ